LRALITGITGMAGSHLAEYILNNHPDVTVFGTVRWRSKMDNLEDLLRDRRVNQLAQGISSVAGLQRVIDDQTDAKKANLVEASLTDATAVRLLIAAVRPDRIFHLAAQSFVPTSWTAPAETLTNNIVSQVNIFEAIREVGIDPMIHIAGSSEEYGLVFPNEVPIKETNPLRPLSPYAVSKVTQEMLAWQYNRSYGLKTVVTRGFNHTGPRRGHVFVTSSCAKQVAEIEAGLQEPTLCIGDMEVRRDWTDVRDTVRGYWMSLEKGVPGEVYNVGSGHAYTIREMLDVLLSLSRVPIQIKKEECRMRPSDVRILLADCTKFQTQTGWQPEIPFRTTMRDLLDYWRRRV